MALPLFAVTLFVSAFLLFLVQPMIGKMILPRMGGTPQVWNTCMLFFQCVLLAGYGYTHTISTKLQTRRQLLTHGLLLLVPFVFLVPFWAGFEPFPYKGWYPDPNGIAVLQTLGELAILVGVPFFVVSTSAPLLQRWFVVTEHPAAKDPYFLYGASNLGSLLSLVFYPFLFEPWFALQTQAWIFLGGYVVLFALIAVCIATVWQARLSLQPITSEVPAEGLPELPVALPPEPVPQVQTATAVRSGPAPGSAHRGGITRKKGLKAHGRSAPPSETHREPAPIISRPSQEPVTWWRRIRWILLAAVPSSLMLGVTSYISTDLSPFPLIWIVPLALYLLSFILVFMKWPLPWTSSDTSTFTPHSLVLYFLQPLAILALCYALMQGGFSIMYMFMAWLAFFAVALACHGELARDRPDPRHLTEYFLWMSVGGAVGGIFNGIVAPMLFPSVWEFYIALVVACFIRPVLLETNWLDNFLMNSFPGMQQWAREQSDQMSRSLGRTPDGSTYVLSYTLDVLLGGFMLLLAWFMNWQSGAGFYDINRAFRFLQFIGFNPRSAEIYTGQAYYAVIYGIPLVICGLYSSRPLRFGLAITALLTMNLLVFGRRGEDEILFQGRTYFGVLRVLEGEESLLKRNEEGKVVPKDPVEFKAFSEAPGKEPQYKYKFTYLMHGTTYHGRNYIYRPETDNVDVSRLATTYYHRYGPVGFVMERDNWLPGPQNTYWGDLRMPATTAGNLAAMLGSSPLPYATILNAAVSEPAYATIGLGTGTMASYSRPYQHLTFYEIDRQIREFSLPPPGGTAHFTYLLGAMRRGVNLEILMGDARLSIEKVEVLDDKEPSGRWMVKNAPVALYPELPGDRRTGADGEDPVGTRVSPKLLPSTMFQGREHYYHAIEVDAFSSDAIPVHLITLEAIRLYLSKIRHDGVVMVHTSNRHLDLVQPVGKIVEVLDDEFQQKFREQAAAIEKEFKAGKIDEATRDHRKEMAKRFSRVRCLVAKDSDQRARFLGHFSSEYVMVYYDEKYLKPARDYALPAHNIYNDHSVVQWHAPEQISRHPWTDDYSNLVQIMR